MSKISTADCVKVLNEWPNAEDWGFYAEEGTWKRLRKFKVGELIVREFRKGTEEYDHTCFVVEQDGKLSISIDVPGEVWYYQLGADETFGEGTNAMIVSKSFWEKNNCIDDNHIEGRIGHILPDGFFEECESSFLFDGPQDEARTLLNAAGFVEKHLFDE